ncbi:MAG: rseP, partial [Dehalococcoidia bacterium]|nr:rseP [Dehalococcoidia bacterium]
SINWLPLGGFVRLLGEEDPSETGSLASKSIPVRCLVLVSGSLMNLVLPVVLFSIAFMIPQQVPVGKVIIGEVAAGSPAEQVGIKEGDVILELNSRQMRNTNELIYNIHLNQGKEVALLLERNGQQQTVRATPRWAPPAQEGPLGIKVPPIQNVTMVRESHPIWEAVPLGMRNLAETIQLFRNEVPWGCVTWRRLFNSLEMR